MFRISCTVVDYLFIFLLQRPGFHLWKSGHPTVGMFDAQQVCAARRQPVAQAAWARTGMFQTCTLCSRPTPSDCVGGNLRTCTLIFLAVCVFVYRINKYMNCKVIKRKLTTSEPKNV